VCHEYRRSKLLTFPELKNVGVPHSAPQIWRLEKAGKFPRRVHITPGRVGWVAAEIDAFLKERIAARDTETVAPRPRSPGRPRKTALSQAAA
jgi:prophage regulatory protein